MKIVKMAKRWVAPFPYASIPSLEEPQLTCLIISVPQYAFKIERSPEVKTIRQEFKVLKRLQQCPQICKTRGSGVHAGRFYMVLDLLGQNLVEMRRSTYSGRMDLATAKVCSARALTILWPYFAIHWVAAAEALASNG